MFNFSSLKFYFKTVFFSLLVESVKKVHVLGTRRSFMYVLSNFYSTILLLLQMVRLRQQINFFSTTELVKYDYTFFRFSNYFFSETANLKEYTTQIATLYKRPSLNLFGTAGVAGGLIINSSPVLGTLLRHVFSKDNIIASVSSIPSHVLPDYLLSFYTAQQGNLIAEYILLSIFENVCKNAGMNAQATQQFLQFVRRKKLHTSQ